MENQAEAGVGLTFCSALKNESSYLGHCPAPLYEPLLLGEMKHTAAQERCKRERDSGQTGEKVIIDECISQPKTRSQSLQTKVF